MTEILDMETIYRQERRRWLREEAPRRSFRDAVAGSVPYWIVIVALILFGLSAPHTAEIFNMLTPGWGFIAPIGVEFGLLYAGWANLNGKPCPGRCGRWRYCSLSRRCW